MAASAAMRFDMRLAPFATVSEADLYSECLAMCRWGDDHGIAALTNDLRICARKPL